MRPGGGALRCALARSSGLRRPPSHACFPGRRVHTAALHRSSIEDPYRTLGLSANATDKDIKRAYRQLALKYHPDVAGQSIDSERRFVSIQQAYEVLTGKRQAPVSGAYTRNQHNGWEFQDWFWSFSASRKWSAQHHARPDGERDAARAPQDRTVLNSQLAGLRHRAAIRHTKKSRDEAAPTAAPEAEDVPSQQNQHQEQQQHQQHQQQHQPHHHHQQQHQQQHHHRPAVEYDCTAMSDGVNMANGHGYDPWSPEAAAAAPRPRFTATESAKSRVSGQLGGLRRRAAVKARADAEQARPDGPSAGRDEPAAATACVGGFTAVEDDSWGV